MQITVQKKDLMTPDLKKRLAAVSDPKPALRAMGEVIVSQTFRAFTDAGLRPTSWAPLAAGTLKQRRRKGRGTSPLMASGLLSRSAKVGQVTDSSVKVQSDRKYAGFQQLGTRHIPARPFFPFHRDGRPTARAARLMLAAADAALGLRQ